MKKHIENTRSHLGELAVLSAQTEASERRILKSAQHRLDVVNAQIDRSGGVEAAPDRGQDRYTDLIKERARLHLVIARAQSALA